MDPFTAALDAAANAARGTKRPRHNQAQAPHENQKRYSAVASGSEGTWVGAGYDGYQPPVHHSGYGQPPAERGQQGSHGQPHQPNQHKIDTQQPYSNPPTQQSRGTWGGQVSEHRGGHPMYSAGHQGPAGDQGHALRQHGYAGHAGHPVSHHGHSVGHPGYASGHQGHPPGHQGYPAGNHGYAVGHQGYPTGHQGYPAGQQGYQLHQGNQLPQGNLARHVPQGHRVPLPQSVEPVQSIHSYGARMAYGSGPSQQARLRDRMPAHAHKTDRARGIADERGPRKHGVPQAHKIFIGGLPQNATEGELLKYFEKAGGPVADVLILKDHTSGRHRGFAFVMFEEQSSVDKVVSPQDNNTQLHELRPGKYIEAKRASEKDSVDRGAEDAMHRASTKPTLKNVCMDCGKNNPKFCMPNENKKRWCSECAQKNHPEAVKTRTMKEKKQREDRCEVFQWARSKEPVRCAYWIVADCPNLKAGKVCDRIHECKNCGFTDTKDNQQTGCPNCPDGWWRKRSIPGVGS